MGRQQIWKTNRAGSEVRAQDIRQIAEGLLMYLLDADIIIYALKGDETVKKNLQDRLQDPISISAITLMELYYGAYKSKKVAANLAKVRMIEDSFDIVSTGRESAETCGNLKAALEASGTRLDVFDLAIAACALAHNLTLVTNNTRHFRRVQGLKLTNWSRS